jgi:hypothetical protein
MFIIGMYDIHFYHKGNNAKNTKFTKKTLMHLVLTFVFVVVQIL